MMRPLREITRSVDPRCETDHPRSSTRRRWGTVRLAVAAVIDAAPERVKAIFLDFALWPQIFPLTITGTHLVRRTPSMLTVMVDHRHEGQVLNVLTLHEAGVVYLEERKRRYDATFVNRFVPAQAGTRYVVEAEVRFKNAYALLAPLLGGVVRRAICRYTLAPIRAAAEKAAVDSNA